MRTLLAAALIVIANIAVAADAPQSLSIAIEPLGDRDGGVVARVFFRFANPRAITEAGLFLEGSFIQDGQVPRGFRFAVPRKDDKFIWNNTRERNGKIVRQSRWAVLPDQRNQMAAVHTFAEGKAEIEARLILEADYGGAPLVVAKATESFTVTKTNRPYVETSDTDEAIITEDVAPENVGAVTIRSPRRQLAPRLFLVSVDAFPPVKRVEFRVEDKKVLTRNAPPYTAELDLGDSPKNVTVRAIGYDAAGRYVDADAFVVIEDETLLTVKITHTATPDGLSHFKLSVRNPKGTRLQRIILYAGEKKLHEWDRPPFTLSLPSASLAGVDVVRASVIDDGGYEARDVQLLLGKLH